MFFVVVVEEGMFLASILRALDAEWTVFQFGAGRGQFPVTSSSIGQRGNYMGDRQFIDQMVSNLNRRTCKPILERGDSARVGKNRGGIKGLVG